MPPSYQWVVCETSGRWTAALRIALARRAARLNFTPRIVEVRSLAELAVQVRERADFLGLVEVRRENFSAVLEFLANAASRRHRFTVLLDNTQLQQQRLAADALWEAGAIEVIGSPRNLHIILSLAEAHAAHCSKRIAPSLEVQTLAERAWAALPWQDAWPTVV